MPATFARQPLIEPRGAAVEDDLAASNVDILPTPGLAGMVIPEIAPTLASDGSASAQEKMDPKDSLETVESVVEVPEE